jgi:hypothetical protein
MLWEPKERVDGMHCRGSPFQKCAQCVRIEQVGEANAMGIDEQ